jgi:hypothetical protein
MGGPGTESKMNMANMFAALDKSKKKKVEKEKKHKVRSSGITLVIGSTYRRGRVRDLS